MEIRKKRSVGFKREAVTPNPNNSIPSHEKVDFIRKGKKKKTITKFKQNKNVTYKNEGDQIIVIEKEKKYDETGVARKKRNYVMYESKLGTEKDRDITKIAGRKMVKPQPRVEERIVIQRKRKQFLDNYQYHETKYIKEPQNTSYVFHQRLSEPVGGTYETKTYERQVIKTDIGPYRQSSTQARTRLSRNNPNLPNKTPSTQTYNRQHLKTQTQTGTLNTLNTSTVRSRRPVTKAVTSDTNFKKESRNTHIRQVIRNSRLQKDINNTNILKDSDNTLKQREPDRTEVKKEVVRTEKTEIVREPETNDDQKETQKTETVVQIETENSNLPQEGEVTEYRKVVKKTVTADGKTTTTTETTERKGKI